MNPVAPDLGRQGGDRWKQVRARVEHPAVLACRKALHRAVTVRSSHA
jgi:hypothetical protein